MSPPGSWSARYGQTEVYSEPGYTRVTLPGGASVPGRPHRSIDYRARAIALGYRDAEGMCQDHDPMHALLAHALGLHESPALRAAADGRPSSELTDAEETMVLAAQRFLQLARRAGLVADANGLRACNVVDLTGDDRAGFQRRECSER